MLAGRNTERGNAVRNEIRKSGGTAEFIQGDVTDPSFSDRAVAETVAKFGGLDILFANAGIVSNAPFTEITDAQWQDLIATNLTGEFTFRARCGAADDCSRQGRSHREHGLRVRARCLCGDYSVQRH